MRRTFFMTFLFVVLISNLTYGAATVFFKDGSKEVGTSVAIEGNTIYLSKSKELYEFSADEVNMEETQKFNGIGKFSTMATPDSRNGYPAGAGSNDLVEQLMSNSNLDRQIDQFIQQFASGAMSAASANSELNDIFAQALAGFDPQKTKRKVRAYYRSHLDTRTLEAIVAWTKSPLGMKIRDAETSMAVTTLQDVQQIQDNFEENPPPAKRMALIQDLDKAGRATEMSQQLIMDAVSGAMSAIPARSAEKKQARKEVDKLMNQQKADMEPLLRKQVQAGLNATYKNLSDNELREYTTFLRTEPAMKFTKVTMGALSEMTRDMSTSMIRHIVKAVELKKAAQGR
jgi:hypothetical protein